MSVRERLLTRSHTGIEPMVCGFEMHAFTLGPQPTFAMSIHAALPLPVS